VSADVYPLIQASLGREQVSLNGEWDYISDIYETGQRKKPYVLRKFYLEKAEQ
jgi:hypothetical protein